MSKLSKKQSNFLIFICWASYTTAYIGRLNYNASIIEILNQLHTTKEAAGIVSSVFFFSYGAGQLIHGILSKKYNTKFSVTIALAASAVINISMTLCSGIEMMKYLWFFNGIFQSILWSSLIKTLSIYLDNSFLPKAVMVMSTTVAAGTFGAYGLAALFSELGIEWTAVFRIAALLLSAMAVLWFIGMSKTEKHEKIISDTEKPKKLKLSITPVFAASGIVLLLSAIANGFIKDGVTTWVPSILKEEFGVPDSLSIIVTLVLPILSVFGAAMVKLTHKKIKNTDSLNGIFFLGSTIFIGIIILTFSFKNTVVTLLFFGLIASMMSAVNNVITSIIPLYSRDKIDSGLLSGVLNTFCYVGSTLSITLLGHIADNSGWSNVFICIFIFSAAALFVCTVSAASTKIFGKR